jgi:hypothetical protein
MAGSANDTSGGGGFPAGVQSISFLVTDDTDFFQFMTRGGNTGAGPLIGASLRTSIIETPIPAALPLFAAGLGIMGLLGWRRKNAKPGPKQLKCPEGI